MTALNPVGLEFADLCYPRQEVTHAPHRADRVPVVQLDREAALTHTPEGAVSAQPAPSAPDFAEVTIWLTRDALADLLPLFDGFVQARVRYVDSLPDLGDES